ncbi:unnamed protein product [Cochlearia groenlandica]
MGNCAIKPKVLKDSEEDLLPVDRDTTAPNDPNNAAEEADAVAAAARRSEKGKDILVDDDVEEDEHSKRQSLSLLFHEDKPLEKDITNLSPAKSESNIKTGASSDVSKLDTLSLISSNDKAQDSFDFQTRNDLEVKIPKDSKIKTPETPKANESKVQELNFPQDLESKTSEESKVQEVSSPNVLSEIRVTKDTYDPRVLEDKNVQEASEVKSDEVKAAEEELLKVSDVKSSEDLEIQVPKVFEVKTLKTEETEVKTDQEATKEKTVEETVEAREKIDKAEAKILDDDMKVMEEDKESVKAKTEEEEEEEKDLSFEKKVKESTLSLLDNK